MGSTGWEKRQIKRHKKTEGAVLLRLFVVMIVD
jgi:hypothetical protein